MMFPYPSAEGLHVGNMYAFTGSDIYGRMKRMQGHDVFEPIGLDGFGIHSENYALKIGTHPAKQAKISEKRFYKQLEAIGNGFAWNERLETYDPEYYQWTQWVFIQLWKQGLVYRKKQAVNWCPSCKTVLADEQVVNNKCERCSSEVIQKELEQWFFKITEYAEKLLKNLDMIDWSEKIKIAQRNWIGKSEGALIEFPISEIRSLKSDIRPPISVFTTRPDTIFGVTFLVVSPEYAQQWIKSGWNPSDEIKKYIATALKNRNNHDEKKEKTGVFSGFSAINPANKEKIPVWISDYVLPGYGTGAIMAVPAHDERDHEFAEKFHLPVSHAPLVSFDEGVQKSGGKKHTQYRLRDWLISRQRYWGAPIPMIFCANCANNKKGEQKGMEGWYAVPEKNLPVKLPNVKDFRPQGKGESPLASAKSFYETKCPHCGENARRETDVSDTFLDSAWYYLAYVGKKNSKFEIRNSNFKHLAHKWLPVHMYIGGAEHSVLHLLYSRFVAMALHDAEHIDFDEPFTKFRAHGLLIKEGAKMSKSKGNVVNPDEYIKKFGADALRMYLMFLAPFEQGGDFRDAGILGVVRFLDRVWKLYTRISTNRSANNTNSIREISGQISEYSRLLHRTIKKVTDDIENLQYNTAISALMIFLNEMEKNKEQQDLKSVLIFLQLLAPFAPHITEELWCSLGKKSSIHLSEWPNYDENAIQEESKTVVVQVNGKHRSTLTITLTSSQKEIEQIACEDARVKSVLEGKSIKKVIYIPFKVINFVTD